MHKSNLIITGIFTLSVIGANLFGAVFNIEDYGAVSNDGLSDSAAIQSAVFAAANGGGGTVCIPKGTYLVDNTITISGTGVIITGESMIGSRIVNESSGYAFDFTAGSTFLTRCKIQQLCITVPVGETGGGVSFTKTYQMEAEKLDIQSRGISAISFVDFFQSAIRDCHLCEISSEASTLYLKAANCNSGQFIAENTIFKNGKIGVEVTGNTTVDGSTFIACAFNYAVDNAIKIGNNTRHLSIIGSHLEGNIENRILIDGNGIFGIAIKNNHFSLGESECNVLNRGGGGVEVSSNQMINNATYGIKNESGKITIHNNNIWTASGYVGTSTYDATDDGKGIVKIQTVLSKSTVPTAGTWRKGDIIYNSSPASGGYVGWICVTAGTPGTWKGFGAIE